MTDQFDRLDRGVTSVLDARRVAAGEPLPWKEVSERVVVSSYAPNRTRWVLAAASLLLVFGAVAALSTIVGTDDPAMTELPPPSLDPVMLDGVGVTRPLSSIVRGEVAVPTRLFSGLVLEPVIVEDFLGSSWSAYDGVREEADVDIWVSTFRDAGQADAPDLEVSAGGVDWAIRSFGPAFHQAIAEIDRLTVSVTAQGVGLGDLELLLDGLRAGEPQAHAASTYGTESDGVVVTRSSDGQDSLEARFVGEWLCSTTRRVLDSWSSASCVIPAPQEDGSMIIASVVMASPVNGDSSDLDDPRLVTVFTAGFVPADAIGADIVQVDGSTEFASAEDRSDSFDVRFFLDVKRLDDPVGSDPAETRFLGRVDVSAVFDD